LPSGRRSLVSAQRSDVGVIHFGTRDGFGRAHLQADNLARLLLGHPGVRLGSSGRVLLSLMFDGVLEANALPLAWAALGGRCRSRDGVCIEWTADERLERRVLGPLTCLGLAEGARSSYEEASNDLSQLLQRSGWLAGEIVAAAVVQIVLSVISARMLTALPGDIYAHVRGSVRLTAVPRSCLVRGHSGMVLRRAAGVGDPQAHARTLRIAERLSQAPAKGSADDARLVKAIAKARTVPAAILSKVEQRKSMRSELEQLDSQMRNASMSVYLYWTWVLDLATIGTEHTRPVKPSTIYEYPHAVVDELLPRLRDEVVASDGDLARIDLRATLLTALKGRSRSASEMQKAVPALESFAWSMWRLFGVDRVGALSAPRPRSRVRANAVWPHEIEWVFDQLMQRDLTVRYYQQLLVVFALLSDPGCAWRTEDIKHIHVDGVDLEDEGRLLLVDPGVRAGPGKSRSARRPIEPSNERTRTLVTEWRKRRAREEASAGELLFADPTDHYRVRLWGRMTAEINALLKAATGDDAVSIHTLRHTALSMARVNLTGDGVRRFAEASAQAGHFAVTITRRSYMNLYESLLRSALDAYWRGHHLTETQVCRLTGHKPGCVRQRWSRGGAKGARRNDLSWFAVGEAADAVPAKAVSKPSMLAERVAPPIVSLPVLSARDVAFALAALARGLSAEAVRLRFDVGVASWQAIEEALKGWRGTGTDVHATDLRAEIPFARGSCHLQQTKLAPVLAELASIDRPLLLRSAVDSWAESLRGRWIALNEPSRLATWWQWLRGVGIRGDQWVVHNEPAATSEADLVASWMYAELGQMPVMRRVNPRRGRPKGVSRARRTG
jgi:integrase